MHVAMVYPPILYHGLLVRPYSLCSIVAAIKAVAVCPEGNELLPEPSGRGWFTVYLRPLTINAINPAENASETNILPHELRLSTPATFNPNISAMGAYCR